MAGTKQAALAAEKEAYVERVRAAIAQAHTAAAESGQAYTAEHPHMVDGRLTDTCGGANVVVFSPSRKFLNALKTCGEVSGEGDAGGLFLISRETCIPKAFERTKPRAAPLARYFTRPFLRSNV